MATGQMDQEESNCYRQHGGIDIAGSRHSSDPSVDDNYVAEYEYVYSGGVVSDGPADGLESTEGTGGVTPHVGNDLAENDTSDEAIRIRFLAAQSPPDASSGAAQPTGGAATFPLVGGGPNNKSETTTDLNVAATEAVIDAVTGEVAAAPLPVAVAPPSADMEVDAGLLEDPTVAATEAVIDAVTDEVAAAPLLEAVAPPSTERRWMDGVRTEQPDEILPYSLSAEWNAVTTSFGTSSLPGDHGSMPADAGAGPVMEVVAAPAEVVPAVSDVFVIHVHERAE